MSFSEASERWHDHAFSIKDTSTFQARNMGHRRAHQCGLIHARPHNAGQRTSTHCSGESTSVKVGSRPWIVNVHIKLAGIQ